MYIITPRGYPLFSTTASPKRPYIDLQGPKFVLSVFTWGHKLERAKLIS